MFFESENSVGFGSSQDWLGGVVGVEWMNANLAILASAWVFSPFERSKVNRKKKTSPELLDSIYPYNWEVKNEKNEIFPGNPNKIMTFL